MFSHSWQISSPAVLDGIVKKYDGDKYVRHFSCWNQLLCMLFGQFTNRNSLRDLIVTLEAHSKKSYHLGLGKSVTGVTLQRLMSRVIVRIFEEFAYHLISMARNKRANEDFEIKGKVYAFDSTTIDLCLNVFWWARCRKTKGGIKLHTLFDITTQIPAFIHLTPAAVNDMNAMDYINYEQGAYYVFDRGYVDFFRLNTINQRKAFFVIRAKSSLKYRRIYSAKVDRSTGVLCDQTGKLTGFIHPKTTRRYSEE